jgi:polyhydroxyalkanoate synthesis regulator phasin
LAVTEIHEAQSSEDVVDNEWTDMIHKILLAGIGAVALAQDVPEGFIDTLVRYGKISEDSGRRLISAMAKRAISDIHLARSLISVALDGQGHTAQT